MLLFLVADCSLSPSFRVVGVRETVAAVSAASEWRQQVQQASADSQSSEAVQPASAASTANQRSQVVQPAGVCVSSCAATTTAATRVHSAGRVGVFIEVGVLLVFEDFYCTQ